MSERIEIEWCIEWITADGEIVDNDYAEELWMLEDAYHDDFGVSPRLILIHNRIDEQADANYRSIAEVVDGQLAKTFEGAESVPVPDEYFDALIVSSIGR